MKIRVTIFEKYRETTFNARTVDVALKTAKVLTKKGGSYRVDINPKW